MTVKSYQVPAIVSHRSVTFETTMSASDNIYIWNVGSDQWTYDGTTNTYQLTQSTQNDGN